MIEYERDAERTQRGREHDEIGRTDVDLRVPAARGERRRQRTQRRETGRVAVTRRGAVALDVEAGGAHAGLAQVVEDTVGGMRVDHRDTPQARRITTQRVDQRAVVGPVDAGRDENAALQAERIQMRDELFGRGHGRRVAAPGGEWKAIVRAEHMRVRIARSRRERLAAFPWRRQRAQAGTGHFTAHFTGHLTDTVAMSMNQFFGCTTPLMRGDSARGPTSCAIQRSVD